MARERIGRIVLRLCLTIAPAVILLALLATAAHGREGGVPPGRIVYSARSDGAQRGLFVASASGANSIRVTSGHDDFSPRWSPDGRQIAFVRTVGEDGTAVWIVNTDGTNARPLDADHRYAEHPRWSPGGRWIAYQVQTSTHLRSGTRAHFSFDLWLVRPEGTGRRRLVRNDGDVVNENPRYYVATGTWAWSPDGRYIAYVCCSEDAGGVRILDVRTGRRWFRGPGQDVAWSPDSRKLAVTVDTAFEIGAPGCGTVAILPRDRGPRRRLVRPPRGACDRWPRWSPDGRSIVFARSAPESTRNRLFAATPKGRNVQRVLPLATTDQHWSSRCGRLFEYASGYGSGWVVRPRPRGAPRFVRFPIGSRPECNVDDLPPCAAAGDWRC